MAPLQMSRVLHLFCLTCPRLGLQPPVQALRRRLRDQLLPLNGLEVGKRAVVLWGIDLHILHDHHRVAIC